MGAGGVRVLHRFEFAGRSFRLLELPHLASEPPQHVLELYVGGDLGTVRASDSLWTRAVGMEAALGELARLAELQREPAGERAAG